MIESTITRPRVQARIETLERRLAEFERAVEHETAAIDRGTALPGARQRRDHAAFQASATRASIERLRAMATIVR
jgi:hypothetical protein